MTETPWDPSLVDPTAREFDGLILRSVGGRTGPVTLENGQRISFPFRAQQEVAGSTPPNIGAEHQAAGSTMRLVIQGGAAFNGTPEISMIAPLPGSLVPPSITLLDDLLSTPNANSIVLGGTAGGVQIDGQSLTINSAGGLSLASDDSITLSTSGAGDDLILDPTGALTATGSSISLVSDGNGNVTITASGTGDLALTGAPVSINGVDVSTSLGQWTDYTPTLSQDGTISNTITYCRYKKRGREVTYQGFLVATAGGTSGQPISVTLPFTAAIASFHPAGSFYFYDAAPGTNYAGTALIRSTSSLGFLVDQAGEVGSNPSFAIASGDQVKWEVVYEATS